VTRIRPVAVLALLVACAAALAACGKKEASTTAGPQTETNVRLLLDYLPNADHVGIFAAKSTGEFEKAGLNVDVQQPSDAATPLKLLLAGKTDLAISYEPELLLARDKGQDLVSVAALVQKPLTSIMSLDKGFKGPKSLKGGTVGTAGIPYQSAYLKTILGKANVPEDSVKEVNVGFNLVPAMVGKKVDATLGAFWNVEGVQLKQEKKDPTIIPVDEAGVPTYDELVLVGRASWIQDHGPTVRRVIQAIKRGTDAVKANPQVGVDALQQADPSLKDEKFLKASIAATLPVLYPEDDKNPFGWQSSSEWEAFSAWMLQNQLITKPQNDAALTNEFLPGEGI
jgi:putative hydroxymethylpyrimidine transport system substrate-binding protein